MNDEEKDISQEEIEFLIDEEIPTDYYEDDEEEFLPAEIPTEGNLVRDAYDTYRNYKQLYNDSNDNHSIKDFKNRRLRRSMSPSDNDEEMPQNTGENKAPDTAQNPTDNTPNNINTPSGVDNKIVEPEGSTGSFMDRLKNFGRGAKNTAGAAKSGVGTAAKETGKIAAKETGKAVAKGTGKAVGEGAKKGIVALAKSKYGLIILGVIALLLLIIILIVPLMGGDQDEDSETSFSDEHNFTLTTVNMKNSLTTDTFYTASISDFAMGAAYAELTESIKGLSDNEKKEVYKAYLTYAKSDALSLGNYDSSTKEITINIDTTGIPYCNPYGGCTIYTKDGQYYYAPYSFTDDQLPGTFYTRIEPMESSEISILDAAAEETKYLLLVPDSVQSVITKGDYGRIPYSPNIKNNWISKAKSGKDYKDLIAGTSEYANYKIYNHEEMSTRYNFASRNNYWWPIGSANKDSNNLYSGTPTATTLTAYFDGNDSIHNGSHGAIDIGSACGSNVIASRDGTVIATNDGCPAGYYGSPCGGGAGNFVKLDHGDGITTTYMHLTSGTLQVKKGDRVAQGQLLGKSGTSGSSTGCHLHFEVRINNVKVDPLSYVDPKNPRPMGLNPNAVGDVKGSDNKQSVCLTLKQIGFSNNAVASLMTNISHESGFRLTALGDSGTSYGLCQWHNGRYTKLRNYCGGELNTVKCQINYLMTELQSGYTGVYNYLQTNNSTYDMTYYFCYHFEVPANRGSTCARRGNASSSFFNYVNNGCR